MHKYIVLLGSLLLSVLIAHAQQDYKVVFDLTSKDSIDHQSVIRWLNEITKVSNDAKIEVVMYGKGISLAVKGKSSVSDDVTRLAANPNIRFKVCAAAMKNQGIQQAELLAGVETVPDGIYEIIRKQKQGWGYIKVKN